MDKNDVKAARDLLKWVTGKQRIRLLLVISERYVFQLESTNQQIARAYGTIMDAINLSERIDPKPWLFESLLLKGKYHFARGETKQGVTSIMEIIESCDYRQDFDKEARYWSELGIYMPISDSTYKLKLNSHEQAIKYYLKADNRKEAAISLLHQKLYSAGNVASISMPSYVSEMVNYLKDSYDIKAAHITIQLNIEDLELEVTQALPLGLILNEAITNSFKNAFKDAGGEIAVVLRHEKNRLISFAVIDNGTGMPENFHIDTASTVGMEMMKALS